MQCRPPGRARRSPHPDPPQGARARRSGCGLIDLHTSVQPGLTVAALQHMAALPLSREVLALC